MVKILMTLLGVIKLEKPSIEPLLNMVLVAVFTILTSMHGNAVSNFPEDLLSMFLILWVIPHRR